MTAKVVSECIEEIHKLKEKMIKHITDVCGEDIFSNVHRRYQFVVRWRGMDNPVYIKSIDKNGVNLIDSFNTIYTNNSFLSLSFTEIEAIFKEIEEIKHICSKEIN